MKNEYYSAVQTSVLIVQDTQCWQLRDTDTAHDAIIEALMLPPGLLLVPPVMANATGATQVRLDNCKH